MPKTRVEAAVHQKCHFLVRFALDDACGGRKISRHMSEGEIGDRPQLELGGQREIPADPDGPGHGGPFRGDLSLLDPVVVTKAGT